MNETTHVQKFVSYPRNPLPVYVALYLPRRLSPPYRDFTPPNHGAAMYTLARWFLGSLREFPSSSNQANHVTSVADRLAPTAPRNPLPALAILEPAAAAASPRTAGR